MRALVVYETLWGDPEQVARAVAAELESTMTVEVVDSDSAPASVDGFDLLVVGAPTHAFSMSRPSTREQAGKQRNAPHVPTRGIREWLETLSRPDAAITALTFDTRVNAPRLPGSAAKVIRHELRSLGFDTPVKAQPSACTTTRDPSSTGNSPARPSGFVTLSRIRPAADQTRTRSGSRCLPEKAQDRIRYGHGLDAGSYFFGRFGLAALAGIDAT